MAYILVRVWRTGRHTLPRIPRWTSSPPPPPQGYKVEYNLKLTFWGITRLYLTINKKTTSHDYFGKPLAVSNWRLWASELNEPPVNIGTCSTCVVAFGGIRQIFTIPQTKRLPWGVVWGVTKRKDKRRRQTAITRNTGPLPQSQTAITWRRYKPAQWQDDPIARAGCYGNTNVISHHRYPTAPVRPAVTILRGTGYVTIQVNQLYGC